jgi:hypothetical protein
VGASEPAPDPILVTIAGYRQAARAIVEANAPLAGSHGKALAIVKLAETLREIEDRVVREWSREAIWREVRDLLGWTPPLVEEPRLPYAERVRLFVTAGYRDCPCCGRRMEPASIREAS